MRRAFPVILLIILGIVMFGVAEAVQDPRIVRYRVEVAGISAPVRIVQLSDTHGDVVDMPPARLDRIVAQVNGLKPDMIVLTGDYMGGKLVDWPRLPMSKLVLPFGKLRAPLGVFAVLGNHDDAGWATAVFARAGVPLLVDRSVEAGPFVVTGLNDLSKQFAPVRTSSAVVQAGGTLGKPQIVIMHEPDFFQWLPRGPALIIAGHTHGGQIRLPFIASPILTPFLRAHLRGVFFEGGRNLVVSSGIGTSLVPMRIGVPPEIVEITLVPKR